jgi:hypothetical protein
MLETGSDFEPTERPAAPAASSRRADWIALGILAALITLLFVDLLSGINSLYIRDVSLYYYPAKHVLRDIVLGGEFPAWNPYFSAGQPMAANPEHEVFYPLTWLILLPRFDLAFHLLIVLHVYISAGAMYAFLRSLQLRPAAAFFGALSFSLGGLALSYLNLLPYLFAIAWLPLTCLYARRFLRDRRPRDFAIASCFFGLQLLAAEPVTILQTGILLGLYALVSSWRRGGFRDAMRSVAFVGLISCAALLLAAVQILPAADHVADSVRGRGFAFSAVTSWSMPPARVGELLHPNLFGHQLLDGKRLYWAGGMYPGRGTAFLHSIYPGLLVTVLMIAGLLQRVRGSLVTAVTLAVSILLATGSHTPLWQFLYDLGLTRSMRYPEKFIAMGVFALITFGAIVLDRLLAGDTRLRKTALLVAGTLTAVAAVIALVTVTPLHAQLFIAAWHPPLRVLTEMLAASRAGWLLVAARGALLFILLRNLPKVRQPRWLLLLGVFVVLDLGLLVPEIAPRVPSAFYREPPLVARQLAAGDSSQRLFHLAAWRTRAAGDYLSPQRDIYWIYRNALYPPMPGTWGIRTAIDVDYDLTALLPTADFTDSVWALSQRRSDWVDVVASMSGVTHMATFIDPALAYARSNEDRRVLQPVEISELAPHPRYSFANRLEQVNGKEDFVTKLTRQPGPPAAFTAAAPFVPARGRILASRETATTVQLDVETAGRAFLVLRVTPHKYWRLAVDGQPAEAVATNIGYQGVVIPSAGRHTVEMRYRNPLFAVGGMISLAAILAMALLIGRRW